MTALTLVAGAARGVTVADPTQWPGPSVNANIPQRTALEDAWYPSDFKDRMLNSHLDPAHLSPIKMTDENKMLRIKDQLKRRFPNPEEGAYHEYMRAQNVAPLEDRLRGPYGMGGPSYAGWDSPSLFKKSNDPKNDAITNRERSIAEKLVSRRFKPLKVGPTADHPIGDEYEQAHQIDVMHRPGMIGYGESTLNAYKANGQIGRMGRMISPDMPHIHPSVQVMAPRPGDYEKNSGADYLFAPPEIMAPKPPYLYPAHRPGEMNYNVPAERSNEYPHQAPAAYPEPPPLCIPAKDLPFVRSYTPEKLVDEYCVPVKYLPFYHPTSWRMGDQANPGNGGSAQPGGGGDNGMGQLNLGAGSAPPGADGPYFVAPPTPSPHFQSPMPFSHGPRFPAFDRLGQGGPPPQAPPPPPANYPVASLLNKAPPLPPPPMPPPMYPF